MTQLKNTITGYGNAGELAECIIADARKQAEVILRAAEEKSDAMLLSASNESAVFTRELLDQARKEAAHEESRMYPGANLERRKIILNAYEKIVSDIFDSLKRKAQEFRGHASYKDYLLRVVSQGLITVSSLDTVITASAYDAVYFNEEFWSKLNVILQQHNINGVVWQVVFDEHENDIGAVVQSGDKRIKADNRFSVYLSRIYNQVRTDILKEVLGENV